MAYSIAHGTIRNQIFLSEITEVRSRSRTPISVHEYEVDANTEVRRSFISEALAPQTRLYLCVQAEQFHSNHVCLF